MSKAEVYKFCVEVLLTITLDGTTTDFQCDPGLSLTRSGVWGRTTLIDGEYWSEEQLTTTEIVGWATEIDQSHEFAVDIQLGQKSFFVFCVL